jgi:hypothetical protein
MKRKLERLQYTNLQARDQDLRLRSPVNLVHSLPDQEVGTGHSVWYWWQFLVMVAVFDTGSSSWIPQME